MKEAVVSIGIMAIIGSMLFALPTPLLDVLLVTNLTFAIALLVSTLYVSEPLKLSSLPTMLLIATLFRLSLNISTTRLILGAGDAGQVVEAFGSVVMQGNLMVGAVIFLVITLVQFIVVAKGSERVAEVAARFTLDALPGKQMSIDADVRAGLIDFETARQKRNELQTESRFYGALDGAMKFIKGDAIAGIVIILINVVGGLIVGLALNGLSLTEALARYTTLTVGDGLVSQIPSLLNSLAAGMVVTRVVGSEKKSLAADLCNQFGDLRKVRLMVAFFSATLSLLPGLPMLPFLAISLILFATGLAPKKVQNEAKQAVPFKPRPVPVLEVSVSDELLRKFGSASKVVEIFDTFRQRVFESKGMILTIPDLRVIPEKSIRISVRGIGAREVRIEELGEDASKGICAALESVVDDRAYDLIDDVFTRRMLDHYDAHYPELISSVVPGVVTLTQCTEILRALVSEGIPLRNFDMVLQAIAEWGPKAGGERALLEEVRCALGRVISSIFSNQQGLIPAITVDPIIDFAFTNAEREKRPVEVKTLSLLMEFFQKQDRPGVLIVSKGARRLIKDFLRARGVTTAVLAHEEISGSGKVEVLDSVTISETMKDEIIDRLAA